MIHHFWDHLLVAKLFPYADANRREKALIMDLPTVQARGNRLNRVSFERMALANVWRQIIQRAWLQETNQDKQILKGCLQLWTWKLKSLILSISRSFNKRNNNRLLKALLSVGMWIKFNPLTNMILFRWLKRGAQQEELSHNSLPFLM